MGDFSHLDEKGTPTMVDVGDKEVTDRTAIAQTIIQLDKAIVDKMVNDEIHTKKGPIFHTAVLAGIMAVKKTSELIPLCHPLPISKCSIDIDIVNEHDVRIRCTAKTSGKTGVEMEALTGASVAALTIYDMCKGFSHDIVIRDTQLIEKTGGKSDVKRG